MSVDPSECRQHALDCVRMAQTATTTATAWRNYLICGEKGGASMGVETALLFCAIRATETMGAVSFARERAGYEVALCVKRDGELSTFCLTSPALLLNATLHPSRFGSVASC
jgi:hypothetical protein